MRPAKGVAAAVLAGAVLAACGGGNVLDGGTVVGRDYDDADSWWSVQCMAYDKGVCTMQMPIEHHDPAHWYLTIEGRHEGKLLREDHEVSADAFYEIEDGTEVDLRDGGGIAR